jgi:hypothetical protein
VRPGIEELAPIAHAGFDLLAPGAVLLTLEERQERAQRLGRVALETYFHRISDAEHLALEIDLDAARLALVGQVFRIRK